MTALGVTADPGGWQYASDVLTAAVNQLTNELDLADAHGGSGLRASWYGPVADAHQELWGRRYGRYGDLLYQAGRAAGALADFAGQLAGFAIRAINLESQWLRLGLGLTHDGMQFTLPWGWENFEHEIQSLLHARLTDAVRDVEAMWDDIRNAVSDLLTVVDSVIDAVGDFGAIELSVALATVSWAARETYRDLIKDPFDLASNVLDTERRYFGARAEHNLAVARELSAEWTQDADQDVRTAGRTILTHAEDDHAVVGDFDHFAKVGGDVMLVGAAFVAAGETYLTARKVGWVNAIEDHSGDWASLATAAALGLAAGAATAVLVTAGAPVLVAAIGVTVGIGVVSMGVGDLTQWYVDHHEKQVGHALTDVGHGIESIENMAARTPVAQDL